MDVVNLNCFLTLGYFLEFKNEKINIDITEIPQFKQKYSKFDKEELFTEAKKIWYDVFNSLYKEGNHVVPISGGLDSRAILATLLEFTDAQKISTYTFGTPGTYDYDIGNKIAKVVGSNHQSFSFDNYQFSTEKEIDVSNRTNNQSFLFHHPPLELIDRNYSEHNMWSGFMLDWIAGSHQPVVKARSYEEANLKVLQSDKFVKSVSLLSLEESEINLEFKAKMNNDRQLSLEEQLEVYNRYPKYIGPNILFENLNFILPGFDKNLSNFYFSLPDHLRKKEIFYKEFLRREFSFLFDLPVKSLSGLSFSDSKYKVNFKKIKNKAISKINNLYPIITNPHTNYMDFNEGIRKRADLNAVVYNNILDLKKRNIVGWIDILGIYDRHMKRKGNHADALIVLSSLEIHLKAGKKL